MFNNKYYKQVDGAAMGSPLGPDLANIFICSFESKWLRNCPNDFKPMFYRRYIDDIFVLFLLLIMQINLGSIFHLNIPT